MSSKKGKEEGAEDKAATSRLRWFLMGSSLGYQPLRRRAPLGRRTSREEPQLGETGWELGGG